MAIGGILTGDATDPNIAPLVVLLAAGMLPTAVSDNAVSPLRALYGRHPSGVLAGVAAAGTVVVAAVGYPLVAEASPTSPAVRTLPTQTTAPFPSTSPVTTPDGAMAVLQFHPPTSFSCLAQYPSQAQVTIGWNIPSATRVTETFDGTMMHSGIRDALPFAVSAGVNLGTTLVFGCDSGASHTIVLTWYGQGLSPTRPRGHRAQSGCVMIPSKPDLSPPPERSEPLEPLEPPKPSETRVSRRLFLAGAGVAVGAGLYATYRTIGDRGSVATGLVPATNRTLESVGGWLQPQTRRSSDGELATTLRVSQEPVPIGTTMVNALTYERMYPGPTLEVEAGDHLVIDLVNEGSKATNLHTHGLHVSPRSPSDNVLMALDPGRRYRYEFDIPADHPAGTYWYHAHWGMLTDLQVFGGLFGALVVRGELDQLEGIAGLPERVMVLSQIQTSDGAIVEGDKSSIDQQVTLINGLYQPTVRAEQGETQRWRLVNAGTLFYRLQLDGHPLRVIGIDGNPLTVEEPTDILQIPPGGRADVLVTADAEGTLLSGPSLGSHWGTSTRQPWFRCPKRWRISRYRARPLLRHDHDQLGSSLWMTYGTRRSPVGGCSSSPTRASRDG